MFPYREIYAIFVKRNEWLNFLYNIWRSRDVNDPELFKKLDGNIWEFRTKFLTKQIRLLAFWDKAENTETIVIATHGFVKKTQKTPKVEIEKAEKIREQYFKEKGGQ